MNGWIKLHRKTIESAVFRDEKAFRVFIWLLTTVDRHTGKRTIGRFQGAEAVKMNPNTFKDVLKRLEEKHQIITTKTTNKFTEISLLNWDKYQSQEEITPTKHQQNTNKTPLNKNKEVRSKNNIIHADDKSQRAPTQEKEIKKYERKALEKRTQLERVVYYLEDELQTNIVTWPKQAKALSMMLKAGYTEEQIRGTIHYMATKDDFFRDKGFDLMNVANQISRYKAMGRKEVTSYG